MYLGTGQLDAAFLFEPPIQSDSLVVEPLCKEPIVIVCHPANPLTKLTGVTAADIENQTVLLTENGCHYRRIFEEALTGVGVRIAGKLELCNVEAIKRCVMAGVGIAALPKIAVEEEVAQGRVAILPWTGCKFDIVTQLAWHKDKWMSPALRAFIAVTQETLRSSAASVSSCGTEATIAMSAIHLEPFSYSTYERLLIHMPRPN